MLSALFMILLASPPPRQTQTNTTEDGTRVSVSAPRRAVYTTDGTGSEACPGAFHHTFDPSLQAFPQTLSSPPPPTIGVGDQTYTRLANISAASGDDDPRATSVAYGLFCSNCGESKMVVTYTRTTPSTTYTRD